MKTRRLTIQERADQYNIPTGSKWRAKYRFTAQGWRSMMTYIGWEIKRATKAGKAIPKIELLKEIRGESLTLQCGSCKEAPRFGGAAMTMSECKRCHRSDMYGSTATPVFCNYCAFRALACQYCGNELDEGTFA